VNSERPSHTRLRDRYSETPEQSLGNQTPAAQKTRGGKGLSKFAEGNTGRFITAYGDSGTIRGPQAKLLNAVVKDLKNACRAVEFYQVGYFSTFVPFKRNLIMTQGNGVSTGSIEVKRGFPKMFKGGVVRFLLEPSFFLLEQL